MNRKRVIAVFLSASFAVSILTAPSDAQRRRGRPSPSQAAAAATPDNGCDLTPGGSDKARKPVKLRRPGLAYTQHNGGRAVGVADFFSFVCTLDAGVPAKKSDIPVDRPMASEKEQFKLRAYVLAMKRDPDNDLHVQVADAASPYNQQQLIVEIPPGADYCDARSALMDLFRADGGKKISSKGYKFKHPPHVELTGYLFLDAWHINGGRTDYCTNNGGRGIKGGLKVSPVRGLWEVHPVLSLKSVS